MGRRIPAWSSQFTPDALQSIDVGSPVDRISWEEAFGGSTGKGIKVAVVDSGIEATHTALQGSVQGYVAFQKVGEEIIASTEPHGDESGHGTACAGIIRAIAPDCELYSVKVLGSGTVGQGVIFVEGLRWAIANGIQVCNLSLGTTRKEFFAALHEVTDLAYFHHMVLITAANNYPIPSFPSMYAAVISVAAHDEQDAYRFYYNPAPPVEFGALGIGVRVAWKNNQWIIATGNSFAAPHITGIVTKLLGNHPHLTPFQVKTALRALAANAVHVDRRCRAEAGRETPEAEPSPPVYKREGSL
ncbi:MAG TPA: S8 family serine peptidase [Ktedonobacteraceae bacterium]|nr:S8 family serine peptidase [Ktedonobacteraceae bacterium]